MRCVFVIIALLTSASALVIPDISSTLERPICRHSTNCHDAASHTSDGFLYKVNGHQIFIDFLDGIHFILWCNSNTRELNVSLAADDAGLPAMPRPVTVEKIVFKGCVVPRRSYYDALKALNVTVSKTLLLELRAERKLEIHHLSGLSIANLEITADDPSKPPRPALDYLDKVPMIPGLRELKLKDVVPEPEALIRLPRSLENLSFVNVRLPAAEHVLRNSSGLPLQWMERLHSLRAFHLVESKMGAAESPGALLTPPQLASLPNLTIASLHHVPLDQNGLSDWLKGSALKNLIIVSCGLTELPSSMFEGTNLTKIIFINNNLTYLPDGVFSPLRWLRELDLSNNRLNRAALIRTIVPLAKLEILKVNNNPLGSLCGDTNFIVTKLRSQLPRSLRRLELSGTHAARICFDWVENEELMHIDLSNNDIGDLTYGELEMRRTLNKPVWLNLSKNPQLRMIEVSRSNVSQCMEDATQVSDDPNVLKRVAVEMKLTTLACDCSSYWLREALRYCPLLKLYEDVTCAPQSITPVHATLLAYGPDEILCPYHDACLPECSCWKRPRDNATVVRCAGIPTRESQWPPSAPEWPLVLHVPAGALTAIPRVSLAELHAPNNNITSIDDYDIPDTLTVLDVRNNSIVSISLAAAKTLTANWALEKNNSVYLSGNRLACECADAPTFELLKRVVLDWNTTQCVDQTYVSGKTKSEMCANLLLPILFGVAVPLLVIVVAGLLLQRLLPHVKQFLFQRNLCLRWILSANDNINDPDKTHDVFLSYAYQDLERLKELKSGLESRGYTTIEHCNDWKPGDPVMQQIARSVLSARRTLLLVSDNYAQSKWALEEFRAAHGHAMERRTARVLIVRCGLNKPEALPSDLQLYLYNNTYLAWDDPKFWYKLCRVMPPLRQEQKTVLFGHDDTEPPSSELFEQDKNLPLQQEIPLVPQVKNSQPSPTGPLRLLET